MQIDLQKFNGILNATRIIFSGVVLAVVIIATGATYMYLNFDSSTVARNPILDTNFFNILNTFKKENINFSNISKMMDVTFESLNNTNIEVPLEARRQGRIDPFAK